MIPCISLEFIVDNLEDHEESKYVVDCIYIFVEDNDPFFDYDAL
jgi:hypothetical protein